MSLDRALKQMLESLQRAGLAELPRPHERQWELPTTLLSDAQVRREEVLPTAEAPWSAAQAATGSAAPTRSTKTAQPAGPAPQPAEPSPPRPTEATKADIRDTRSGGALPPSTGNLIQDSETRFMNAPVLSRAEREACLSALAERVAACQKCSELARTRTQTVFGVGNPEAQIMFIGEAPGADEDKQGEPFVGRAGQLLNRIIEACGWKREDLYICNILRCRPPGNRNPTKIEADQCRDFLDGQIEAVNPRYIVCWGTIAAQNLLGSTLPIGRMRGKLHAYGRAQVLCTYHPSYLLRNPSARKDVRDDLQILLEELGEDPDRLVKK